MAGHIGAGMVGVANGSERKQTYAITQTTTNLTGLAYTPTKVHVYHNGIRLVDGTDYTATNGTSITLTTAAEDGDEVVVISNAGFQVSDTVSAANGGTFAGNVVMSGTLDVTGATSITGATTLSGDLNVGTIKDATGTNTGISINSDGIITKPYLPAFHSYSSTYTASGEYYFHTFQTTGTGIFNRGGHFDYSSGIFTCPVSGLYQINYVFHDTVNTAARKIGRIFINNYTTLAYPELAEGYDTYEDSGGAVLLELNANDTVRWATHPAGTFSGCTASAFLVG